MRILALTIGLIFSVVALSQEKSSDAVFEKITSEYTLKEDGSMEYHHYKKLRMNTHLAFNRLYGETFIVYNPAYQTLKINICRTTQQDGKVTEAPFNAFNEVLPGFATGATAYNGLREMVVTHPGLEVGAVIELDYTITTKPGFLPGLMADEVLTESSPVMEKDLIVHVPAGMELNYKVMNVRTSPETKESKSGISYTFTFKDIKESSHEDHQPGDQTHLPRVCFSTLSFQEAIGAVTGQESFTYGSDKALDAVAGKLRDEYPDDTELALAVQKMVSGDVNTWPVPPAYIGYSMRPATETWATNGGTPCEKTILMTAILRAAGINANPVMVIPSKLYDAGTGCLPLAENFLLQVNPRDKEQMYISAVKASEQNLAYGLTGKTILLFEPTKQYVESVTEQFGNKVITNGDLVLDENFKAAGKMEISLTEAANPYYSFMKDSTHARSLVTGGLNSKDIVSAEILNTAQFRTLATLTVEAGKGPEALGDYRTWEIPGNKAGTYGWRMNSFGFERTDPFEVPSTIDEEYSFNIVLPDDTELLNPVDLTERETGFGSLVLSTKQKGNTVTVKRMLKITRTEITPEEYAQFKEMMDLWNEKNFRRLVLRKVAGD